MVAEERTNERTNETLVVGDGDEDGVVSAVQLEEVEWGLHGLRGRSGVGLGGREYVWCMCFMIRVMNVGAEIVIMACEKVNESHAIDDSEIVEVGLGVWVVEEDYMLVVWFRGPG